MGGRRGRAPPALMLDITGVARRVPNGTTALDGINLSLNQGDFLALLGPSGCGKSTLLRLIAGLIDRSTGHLTVHGRDIKGPRTDVGLMFQKATLLEWRTAAENVLLPVEIGRNTTSADRTKAMEYLELVGLKDFAFSFPSQLSGGMQQRVALARLLMTGADVLLLDEPFAGVDPIAVIEIQRIVRFLKERGIGVLITDHNVRETLGICDRAYIINDGIVLASGRPDDLIQDERVRKAYLGEEFRM
jgi:NitT/TauT family transport system ATP-binding protein